MEKHPLEDLSEIYLSEQAWTPRTMKTYRLAFQVFIRHLKEHDILYPKTSDVIFYREMKRRQGHSSYSIYIQMTALRGFYRYLRMNHVRLNLPQNYSHDIMMPIKNEKITPALHKQVLTPKEAKILILETKNKRKYLWHYRDHAMIYLMLTSALRPCEIVEARKEDYQYKGDQRVLYIRRDGKKDENHYVHLAKGAIVALDDYLSLRHDDHTYLFISHKQVAKDGKLSRMFFRDMFLPLRKISGLEDTALTPHRLRHTAAIINLSRGASLEETKAFMRHASISSTKIYQDYLLRMEDDAEEMVDAFILKEEPNDESRDDPLFMF